MNLYVKISQVVLYIFFKLWLITQKNLSYMNTNDVKSHTSINELLNLFP